MAVLNIIKTDRKWAPEANITIAADDLYGRKIQFPADFAKDTYS